MYTHHIVALTLAALLPAINAQEGVTCQTSDASPAIADITEVINQLKGKGGICSQKNGHASDCTTLVSHDSAAIIVCGAKDSGNSAIDCVDVASFAMQIQDDCASAGRSGGTYSISASKRVEVIHS